MVFLRVNVCVAYYMNEGNTVTRTNRLCVGIVGIFFESEYSDSVVVLAQRI